MGSRKGERGGLCQIRYWTEIDGESGHWLLDVWVGAFIVLHTRLYDYWGNNAIILCCIGLKLNPRFLQGGLQWEGPLGRWWNLQSSVSMNSGLALADLGLGTHLFCPSRRWTLNHLQIAWTQRHLPSLGIKNQIATQEAVKPQSGFKMPSLQSLSLELVSLIVDIVNKTTSLVSPPRLIAHHCRSAKKPIQLQHWKQ